MEVGVFPHRDLVSCTNMSINSTSSLALLAGRRCFAIVDLSNPASLKLREARQSKWEVVCSEWSVQEERLLAVASNNKVELVTCRDTELVVDAVLRSHTRAVTDLAWHTHDRQLLATSSADNYIYLWDMRDLRRPSAGLQAVQGAAKVEWNKVSGKYLASTHDGEVKLWDIRKSNVPVQYINAHLSRIYSLDWSWDHEDSLATSSQDNTVHFWNLAAPGKAENTIKTSGAPVWQLQHTPFGSGLLTLVMHTMLRGENNLVLWNRTDLRAPVHTFYGHTDMVLNFGWRCARPGEPKTRLVTWSKDCTLRLWEMDSELQRKCGQEVEELSPASESTSSEPFFEQEEHQEELEPEVIVTVDEEEGAVVVSMPPPARTRRARSGDSESDTNGGEGVKTKSMNLNYEFKLLNVSDKLEVKAQDAKERLFTVQAETSKNVLILHVKFPPNYPNQKAPVFSFLAGSTVDNLVTTSILNKVRGVAKKNIGMNRRCLEPCLRQFEASVDELEQEEQQQIQLNNPQPVSPLAAGGFQDQNIPFPRSSGARFCGDGHLVTFGCTRQYSVPVARDETAAPLEEVARTPRALTAMMGAPLASGAASPKYSVSAMCGQSPSQENSYFPFKARVSRVRFSNQKSRISVTSDDFKLDRKSSVGTPQGHAVKPSTRTVTIYSCSGLLPPGCKLLATTYLLPGSGPGHILSRQEVCSRNAASAAAAERPDLVQVWSLAALSAGGVEQEGQPWAQHPMGRRLVTDLLQHYLRLRDIQTVAVLSAVFSWRPSLPASGAEAWDTDSCLLEPGHRAEYDCYMRAYSDLLYTWRMLGPRTELVKCLSQPGHAGEHRAKISLSCTTCGKLSPGPSCSSCRSLLLHCSLCRLSCRGLSCVCPSCGHGGHTAHLSHWFSSHDTCPTGCGCPCTAFIS